MVYTEDNEDVKKTIAMMHARSYKEMEELAENSLERMSLYSIFKKLGRDVKFMVFRLEGEELEAFNASVRSELEDKAREKGRKEGFEEGKEEGIEQGRNEGIEQGIEQGIEKGLRALVQSLKEYIHDFEPLYKAVIKNEDYRNVSREQVMKYYQWESREFVKWRYGTAYLTE